MNIDYSQFSAYSFCGWRWYETYVNQRKLRYTGLRSDPLCLGSLTHNALDNFAKEGKPTIDDTTLTENTPTPETIDLANLLVEGYLRKYPKEEWPVERAEQPLLFPLDLYVRDGVTTRTPHNTVPMAQVHGLAKLDGYFYVPEDTTLESGIPNHTLTLSRGWWGKEYKTKSAYVERSKWIQEWQTKRQADFQILALQEHLHQLYRKNLYDEEWGSGVVQGILVCVLEKPREYIPKRKCSGCKESYELASYIPHSEGYMCPVCGKVQKLSPYVPKTPRTPEYFRIQILRSPEQLDVARREITQIAASMEAMRSGGMESATPNRDHCVNNQYHRECDYNAVHTYGGTTATDSRYVTIDAYKYQGL